MIRSHARGRGAGTRSGSRGFTLLEVLVSIAIIALLGTLLMTGTARLLGEQPATAQEVFWKAVQEARKTALKAEHDIRLKFDKDKKQFVIVDGIVPARTAADGFTKEETPLKVYPVPMPNERDDLGVDFLVAAKGGSAILVGGLLIETQTIPYVTFYSDGTCTAFRVQFMRNGAASTLAIDPWTCAQVLTPDTTTP